MLFEVTPFNPTSYAGTALPVFLAELRD